MTTIKVHLHTKKKTKNTKTKHTMLLVYIIDQHNNKVNQMLDGYYVSVCNFLDRRPFPF